MRNKLFALLVAVTCFAFAGCEAVKNASLFTPHETLATNEDGSVYTETEYGVSPIVTDGIAKARTVTRYVPAPYGNALDLALGGLAAGLGLWAKIKSKKSKKSETLLATVIRGVEAGNNSETKSAVSFESKKAGVQTELHEAVQALT